MNNITSIYSLIFQIIIFLTLTGLGTPTHAQSENDIADVIQSLIGGEREYSVTSGRVDLLTAEYAFEVEWANKWKEAVGQSLWYGLQTNRKPGIILIMKSNSDYKYFIQLSTAIEYAGLKDKIRVHVYPNDFRELLDNKN